MEPAKQQIAQTLRMSGWHHSQFPNSKYTHCHFRLMGWDYPTEEW
jgi:hypothetical protein